MPQVLVELFWEIFVLSTITAGGVVLLARVNLLRTPLAVTSPILGLGILLTTHSTQLALPVISSNPIITIGIIATAALAYLSHLLIKKGSILPYAVKTILIFSLFFGILVPTIDKLDLVKFHFDSYEYIVVGDLLHDNETDMLTSTYIKKRLGSASVVHSIANTSGIYYMQAFTPILGIAGLVSVLGFALFGLKPRRKDRSIMLSVWALISLVFLVNPAFIWNLFYINSHIFIACLWLLICGVAWLKSRDTLSYRQYAYLQLILIPALCVSRPEGFLLAALPVFAMINTSSVDKQTHKLNSLALFAGVALYSLLTISLFIKSDNTAQINLRYGIITSASLLLPLALLALSNLKERIGAFLLPLSATAAYLLIASMYLYGDDATMASVGATLDNLLLSPGGWWLATGFIGAALLASWHATRRVDIKAEVLIGSIALFLPLYFIVRVVLEQGVFRLGWGDSLNRAFVHVLFVVALYLLVSTHSLLARSTQQPGSQKR